jgi:hypothetical protein
LLPRHRYEGLSGRLLPALVKAKRCPAAQRLAVRKRLGKRWRHAWPPTLLRVRGDRHLASPAVRQWIAAHADLREVTGLPSNAVVQALAREVGAQAKRASGRDGGKRTRFHATRDQAGTWSRARRVVIKVAVSDQGVNTRFVVTAMEHARPQVVYRPLSCARGQREHASTAHTRSLQSERMSCHRFGANQWRL